MLSRKIKEKNQLQFENEKDRSNDMYLIEINRQCEELTTMLESERKVVELRTKDIVFLECKMRQMEAENESMKNDLSEIFRVRR